MIENDQFEMRRRNGFLIAIILLGSAPFASGCDRLLARIYVEHPGAVQLTHPTVSPTTERQIRRRVDAYLQAHSSSIHPDVKSALVGLRMVRGMSQEQVKAMVGQPSKRKILINEVEVWTYDKDLSGEAFREAEFPTGWYYGWAKLKFQRGTLVDIAVRQIEWKIDP